MKTNQPSPKYLSLVIVLFLFVVALSTVMAKRPSKHPYHAWYTGKQFFPKKLSRWHLFKGKMSHLKPAARWVPYDINVPLFSDYASKHRMVWMPRGTSATYDAKYVFKFPIGTVIAKTFAFPHKVGKKQSTGVVETRLLVHTKFRGQKARWWTLPYVWNRTRTEAYLTPAGGARIIPANESPTKEQFTYIIPNANECATCHHKDKTITPIGPKARNLNGIYKYSTGPENQLKHWVKVGYLKGLPPMNQVPKTPSIKSYKPGTFQPKLARAFLDTNCAHCHQAGGFAGSSALVLNYWVKDPDKLGICKEPVAAGKASGGREYDIVPGFPNKSIMFYRLASTDAAIRMPELGRTITDTQGLDIVGNWIKGINREGKPGGPKGCGQQPTKSAATQAAPKAASKAAPKAAIAALAHTTTKSTRHKRRRKMIRMHRKAMLRFMHQRRKKTVHRLLRRYLKKRHKRTLHKK